MNNTPENVQARDYFIELRNSTGMNRKEFCVYFEIPYMTVTDWERGNRRVPQYLLKLLEHYIKTENMSVSK